MKEYAIIIRTDSYAGNFERELCAHVTGIIGECEVGRKFVDEDIESIFEGSVNQKSDDHGCFRPVSLGGCNLTPGFNSNDVVIWFNHLPTEEQQTIIKNNAATFNAIDAAMNQWHKDIRIESILISVITTEITTASTVI
jgi:hypothetical protein